MICADLSLGLVVCGSIFTSTAALCAVQACLFRMAIKSVYMLPDSRQREPPPVTPDMRLTPGQFTGVAPRRVGRVNTAGVAQNLPPEQG